MMRTITSGFVSDRGTSKRSSYCVDAWNCEIEAYNLTRIFLQRGILVDVSSSVRNSLSETRPAIARNVCCGGSHRISLCSIPIANKGQNLQAPRWPDLSLPWRKTCFVPKELCDDGERDVTGAII